MGPLSRCFGISCLLLALSLGSGKAEHCSMASPSSCADADQTELLQHQVGVTVATVEENLVAAAAHGNQSVTSFSAGSDLEQVFDEDDELAGLDEEVDDPNLTDIACADLETESRCHAGGCTWSGNSCELDDANPDDTNIICGSFQTQSHCSASGCSWNGTSCVEDSDALLLEGESVAIQKHDDEMGVANADTTEELSSKWCRRRRVNRRRWGGCCRRRRAPVAKAAPKDGYHKECWTAGFCKDNGKNVCGWCGQHNGNLMYCCSKTQSYAKGHACHGATFSSANSHICVTPGQASTAQILAYKWLDLSGASASMSSTSHGAVAKRAIDGSASSAWGLGSCTHTNTDNNPWWQVNLGSTQEIKAITVTNRGDCCADRLSPFSVRVGSTVCATGVQIGQGQTKVVPCNAVGSSIRIQMNKRTIFTLCEFRAAIGAPSATTTTTTIATLTKSFNKTLFERVDLDGDGLISSAELQKALDAGTITDLFDRLDLDSSGGITRGELKKTFADGLSKGQVPGTPGAPVPVAPTIAPVAPAPTNAPPTVPSQAQKDAIVNKHNALRAGIGASDMTEMIWDDALAQAAQQWASGCPSGHSQNRPNSVGENIAWKWATNMQLTASTDFTPSVQAWYDEFDDAGPYKTGGTFSGFGPCPGVCGHYTQVVWAAANKIGCGAAFCPHSTGMAGFELVCQYGSSVPGGYGGNMGGSTLFTKGSSCSKCPSGFQACSANLCSSGP